MAYFSFVTKVLDAFIFLFLFSSVGSAQAEESSIRLNNPFLMPQTSLTIGSLNNSIRLSNSSNTYALSDGGFNAYGFDLEVNSNDFLNIGAYLRIESLTGDSSQAIHMQFATLLGGFARFFYVPQFLKGKSFVTSVFTRLELGAGPTVMGGPSGLVVQGGVHLGVETYFNKWLGVSLSYGKLLEWGKETLASGVNGYYSPFKDATIWNQGSIVLVSLKTTFF